jgi:membrane-bound lytic murein transglycosylase B
MRIFTLTAAAAALACAFATPALAQSQASGRSIVSIYRAAPGHQVMLLQWLAQQDRIAAAAGIAPGQLYAHTDGDSWDYVVIFPQTTPAQDDALDATAKKMGLPYGPRVGIELRKHIASHTDTLVRGPMSASDYLAAIGEK